MATRFSPEAVSLGTPSFMRRGRVPTDGSIGLSALRLPIQLGADPQRTQDRVRLGEVSGLANRKRQPRRGPNGRRDQEEERDGSERREKQGPTAVADGDLAADPAESAHRLGACL